MRKDWLWLTVKVPKKKHGQMGHSVDGRNPTPVEAGSLFHYLHGFYASQMVQGFFRSTVFQFFGEHFMWIPAILCSQPSLPPRLEPAKRLANCTKELSRSGIDAATNLGQAYENQSCNLETMGECSYFGCQLLSFKSSGTCSKLT